MRRDREEEEKKRGGGRRCRLGVVAVSGGRWAWRRSGRRLGTCWGWRCRHVWEGRGRGVVSSCVDVCMPPSTAVLSRLRFHSSTPQTSLTASERQQEPSEEEQGETSPARDNSQRCLEAFILLWSKEPGVYAAVEAHLREHPLPGPPDGMEVRACAHECVHAWAGVAGVGCLVEKGGDIDCLLTRFVYFFRLSTLPPPPQHDRQTRRHNLSNTPAPRPSTARGLLPRRRRPCAASSPSSPAAASRPAITAARGARGGGRGGRGGAGGGSFLFFHPAAAFDRLLRSRGR